MKVKSGFLKISNKKKNALPNTVKQGLLKPNQFKKKHVNYQKAVTIGKEKSDLAIKADPNLVSNVTKGKVGLHFNEKLSSSNLPLDKKKLKKIKFQKGSPNYIRLENVQISNPSMSSKKLEDESSNVENTLSSLPMQAASLGTEKKKQRETNVLNKFNKSKVSEYKQFQPRTAKIERVKSIIGPNGKGSTQNLLNSNKVSAAVTGLFKLLKDKASDKTDLLNLAEPVFLQVECIKIPICPTKQLRFKLPHPLVNELSDILLITPDKKGAKIDIDKGVEHYTELLAKHNIDFIRKVMPIRMVRKEYSQYEMRRKLVNQFDLILADASITKMVAIALGCFALYNPKMPIPIHLNRKNLKEHLKTAISKTQMTVKSNGHVSVVKVGHSQMSASDITENIIEVSKGLAELYPGGWKNIRSLNIKTGKSVALPLYLSLVSPNEVRIPVEQPKKEVEVEDELSTMPGMNVIVKPDGTVILKKVAEETLIDDSQDDEILQEAENYKQSSKTIRYGESDEDSDKEADAITEAAERQFLKSMSTETKVEDENMEEEDEEHESSDDDDDEEIVQNYNKKLKLDSLKVQPSGKLPKKKQKSALPQNTLKSQKSKGGPKQAAANKEVNQRRGTRGGKKKKANKDQRKALIKRKKAGKT